MNCRSASYASDDWPPWPSPPGGSLPTEDVGEALLRPLYTANLVDLPSGERPPLATDLGVAAAPMVPGVLSREASLALLPAAEREEPPTEVSAPQCSSLLLARAALLVGATRGERGEGRWPDRCGCKGAWGW